MSHYRSPHPAFLGTVAARIVNTACFCQRRQKKKKFTPSALISKGVRIEHAFAFMRCISRNSHACKTPTDKGRKVRTWRLIISMCEIREKGENDCVSRDCWYCSSCIQFGKCNWERWNCAGNSITHTDANAIVLYISIEICENINSKPRGSVLSVHLCYCWRFVRLCTHNNNICTMYIIIIY